MKKLITLITICTLCISTNIYANSWTYIRTVETQCYHWGDWYTHDWYLFKDQDNNLWLANSKSGLEYFRVRKNGYSTFKGKTYHITSTYVNTEMIYTFF